VKGRNLIFIVVIGCGYSQEPKEPILRNIATCSDICFKLSEMGCEHGEPLPDGTSCEKFCLDTIEFGHKIDLDCIMSKVDECSDMEELDSVCE